MHIYIYTYIHICILIIYTGTYYVVAGGKPGGWGGGGDSVFFTWQTHGTKHVAAAELLPRRAPEAKMVEP